MKMVIASHNSGKIQELQTLLADTGWEALPQKAFTLTEVAETGLTFVENALLKARHACRETGLPAIADDSGLVVPILQGAPGIYSARYAGPTAKSPDNIQKLLEALTQTPASERRAFFHCTLVFMEHERDPAPIICEGEWQGCILGEVRGSQGFGYDPVFGLTDGRSAAELNLAEKNKRSHRGKALQALLGKLREKYKGFA
jgi:XTP/dITP diphosphohydrolase